MERKLSFKYIPDILVIVASVWFLRSKSQDELDKKTNNHLPLPMDYASNEGMYMFLFYAIEILSLQSSKFNKNCQKSCKLKVMLTI